MKRKAHQLKRIATIAAAGALALLSACASTSSPATKPVGVAALHGPEWTIFEINGQPTVPGIKATINFEDGRVYGAGSCNRFMGSYTPGDAFNIKLGQMASTMMACPEPAMQQEGKLLGALQAVTSFGVGPDGVLTLSAPDGQSVKARR